MKKVPYIITKNGFDYKLLRRNDKVALYSQSLGNVLIGFEVFKIRIQHARFSAFLGREQPTCERFPGDEDFGYSAWSYRTMDEALVKFKELERENRCT